MHEISRLTGLAMFLVVLAIDLSSCRPAEEPTRFTLSLNEVPKRTADSGSATGLDRSRMLADESRSNSARSVQGSSTTGVTWLTPRETSRLENEQDQALLERPKMNPVNGILESFLRPKPIVDGIRESEKYGNTGDRFIGIGRALVDGFEGFSNFLNAIIDFPGSAIKKTSRGLTGALNHVGARIVGLE